MAVRPVEARITSYNVCYTKLLRLENQLIQKDEAIKRLEALIAQNGSIIEGLNTSLKEKEEAMSVFEAGIQEKDSKLQGFFEKLTNKDEEIGKLKSELRNNFV